MEQQCRGGGDPAGGRRQDTTEQSAHLTTRKTFAPLRFAYAPKTVTFALPSFLPTRKVWE